MDYLKNHCWCSNSNWGGEFDCQIIVGISSYKDGCKKDWEALTERGKYFDQEDYDWNIRYFQEEGIDTTTPEFQEKVKGRLGWKSITRLKPEVVTWLSENVLDIKGEKGWCIDSDKYISSGSACSLHVFFQRRKDAMAFIKRWSEHKKPINYCQYFTDVRKVLDLKTGKYKERV